MTQFTVRLRKLESRANSGYNTRLGNGEIWIELRDGRMRGRDGTILPREQFEQRRLRAGIVLVLPDNGRDPAAEPAFEQRPSRRRLHRS